MAKTVKELINDLLEYPMDAEVVIEVNGGDEFEINGFEEVGYSWKRVLVKIETEEDGIGD